MSSALSTTIAAVTEAEPASGSEELVARVKALLTAQQFGAAQREAALAAESFPGHPWLRQANRVLNPGRAVAVPSRGPDRTRELDWLRQNSGAYRGKWVALEGDRLIAAGEDFDAVLREVRSRTSVIKPLVHHID